MFLPFLPRPGLPSQPAPWPLRILRGFFARYTYLAC